MTKYENEVLFKLVGQFESFIKEDTVYKQDVKDSLKGLTETVDKGQKEDSENINKLDKRVGKIEFINKLIWGSGGLVGSGGILYFIYDKLIN